MTEGERELWLNLAALVLNPRITDVSKIHRAAKRLKGRRRAIPAGWHYIGSPFHQLFQQGRTLSGSASARAAIAVHAEVVQSVCQGAAVSSPEVVVGVAAVRSRADIDG